MSLGNLSIKVTADIGSFSGSMDLASQAATKSMGSSSDAVEDFRKHLLRTSDDMQTAALSMSSNMEAANEAIVSSSEKAAQAVQAISNSIEKIDTRSMSEKVTTGVSAGAAAGADAGTSAMDSFIDYVKAKLVIAGLVILTGITAAFFTAIYAAYKAVSTIASMMDGSFYKSENIDALIASNKELLELQTNLRLSSIEAGALNEAMKRLGVNKSDYTSVYDGVTKSMRDNGDELDRLGVKYKHGNGKLLESRQFIENVKNTLDGYTEGWDRNAAAAAIGIGSYDKITQVLKLTSAEIQTSKARLDEYQLGVTAGTQKMVAEYETAMREFGRENDLAAQGFKRVYADAVMPIYTDMANLFKQGWPELVQVTRLGVSSIMFFVYAMADGIYIVKESIQASLSVIGNGIGTVAAASAMAMKGDFLGAKNALASGWEDAAERVKLAGSNMVEQIMKNDRALEMATGNDGRDASIENAKLSPVAKGKDWVAKPKDEKAAARGPLDDPAKKLLEGQLKAQEAFIAAEKTQLATREQYLQYYYQLEYTNASDFYGTKKQLIQDALKEQLAAYDKEAAAAAIYLAQADTDTKQQDARNIIAEIAKKRTAAEIEANKKLTDTILDQAKAYREFDLATTQVARNAALGNAQSKFQIEMLGKGTLEVAKLSEARKIELALEQRLYDMRNKNAPQADIERAVTDSLLQKNAALELIEESYNKQRTAIFGASEAMRKYAEATDNQAAQVEGAMTHAFTKAEDAFVAFARTGKLSFKGLADSIISDIIRIQAKAAIQSAMGGIGGGLGGLFSGLFGGGGGGADSVGGLGSSDLVDGSLMFAAGGYDIPAGVNPLTQLHQKEMVLPAEHAETIRSLSGSGLRGGGGGGENITIINQTTGRIDSVTSQTIAPGERQLIIQEAREAVAADLYDPNSRMSRSMRGNYNSARTR